MPGINDALAQIAELSPGEKICYTKIAEKHGVDRSTLSRRHRGVQQPRDSANVHQRKLNPQQEDYLAKYVESLIARHLPPTREMIGNFASAICKKSILESWITRFINNNSDILISKWTTAMDSVRHAADSYEKYAAYFAILRDKKQEYDIKLRYTYNMDEKGFAIGVVGRSKRIFSRADYKRKRGRQLLQDGN
jgi:hypothetical protein